MSGILDVLRRPDFFELLRQHILLSAAALLIAIAIALPVALAIRNTPLAAALAVNIGNIGRAVPSLAILALCQPFLGFGFDTALVALTALAIPPILINTSTGLREVRRDIIDAARGMGLSGNQVLAGIQLPIAAPVIFAGIRTSAVQVVASATLATDIGGSEEGGGSGPTITVGSKNFTEQYILGELYAQALAANGFNVEKKLDLGSEQIADKALQNGQIDLYPEYTGTALVAIVPYEGNPADLNSPQATYEAAKKGYAERSPADTMLEPAPFNNTYGIFVRKSVAEKNGLTNMDELAQASKDLTFISYSEFQNRSDGYPNMQKNYPALDFKEIKIVNELGLRYSGLENDEGDVGVGFTTDGQLTSDQLVVMKDPKSIWPFYYPAPVVRSDVLEKHPKIKGILNEVSASLSVETMRELNGQVDLDQEDPEDVARQHLEDEGIIE